MTFPWAVAAMSSSTTDPSWARTDSEGRSTRAESTGSVFASTARSRSTPTTSSVTDDDDLIEVRSTGVRRVPEAVAVRIAAGEEVGADEYYFRTHVTLATSSTRWERLNGILAISTGLRERDTVRIHVHELL